MRPGGAGAQLRVRLGSDVVRVDFAGKLHVLHQLAVRGRSGEHEPLRCNLVAVLVVDFVAVAVPLADLGGAVGLGDDGAFVQLGFVEAQTHGAAEVALAVNDVQLLFHGGDDRVLGVRFEFAGRCALKAHHVPGVFDDHALEAQAQAQDRQLGFAGKLERAQLAFEAADAEPAGHADGVNPGERVDCALVGFAFVRGDPADLDLGVVGETAGAQCLGD
ncbi:hypothetical protein D9M72_511350 [compost metagenome]